MHKIRQGLKRAYPYAVAAYDTTRAFKRVKSTLKANRKSRRPTSGTVTTLQKDVTRYKSKKYNKRIAKRKVAYANKIKSALRPKQELHVYQETYDVTTEISLATAALNVRIQVCTETKLQMNMGKLFSATENTGFLATRYSAIANSTSGQTNQGAPSPIPVNSFETRITGSVLNVSITNPSTNTIPTLYDVYEFVAAKDIADVVFRTPLAAWNQCMADCYGPIDATSLKPTFADNGQTPYDCPMLGKFWKIMKKTRIYLGPGNTSEYLFNCGKFTLKGDKFEKNYAIAGISKSLLIIGGIGDNSTWPASGPIMRFLPQKSWHHKYDVGESELPQRPTVLLRKI